MPENPLKGKIAMVTGGTRGIGQAIALSLLDAGCSVHITGRNPPAEINSGIKFWKCDHGDPKSISEFSRTYFSEVPGCDILVNNAGCMEFSTVEKMTLEQWQKVLNTNLTGVFLTTKAFLPAMVQKKRGDIFMISSMSGKKGDPGASAYAASKFGLQGFSQSLAYEVRKSNIRVMVLNPSSVDKSSNPEKEYGPGLYLHAWDIASTVVHLSRLPGRTLIRDMDIWGTNP